MLGKTEELMIVLLIILLLFGARKLPELAKGMGQAVKEVRKGFADPVEKDSSDTQTKA